MSTAVAENRISGNGALAPVQKAERLVVQDESPIAYIMDTGRFEHCNRISKMMAACAFMPDHLVKGKTEAQQVANCMLVLSQAMRWKMDPYSVAPCTYVVHGKLGYEGKLIAAVVNARGKLAQNLDVIYSGGKGDDLAAVIYGSRKEVPEAAKPFLKQFAKDEDGEALTELKFMGVLAIRVTVGQCKTTNEMWKKDPQQKLFYTGATKWARRFMPELMLGVITNEDLEMMSAASSPLPETAPRTLDDLTKAVESAATVKLPEPDAKEQTGEVIDSTAVTAEGKAIHPEWVSSLYAKIDMANKVSLLDPIGNEMIADMKNPEVSEADKKQHFPGLFIAWADKNRSVAKQAEIPLIRAKIESWNKWLPDSLYTDMFAAID